MFPGLFTHITDFDSLLIRNIKGIRSSQNLFDDLTENNKEHVLASTVADQDYIATSAALITRPFDYGIAITYPYIPQNWQMTRFSNGLRYGVWYGSLEIETTVYETVYHWQRFIKDSFNDYEDAICADRRVFSVNCQGILVDLRHKAAEFPDLLHPQSYALTNEVGNYLFSQQQNGLLVKSARCNGINAAVFQAEILSDVKDMCYLTYEYTPVKQAETIIKRDSKRVWMKIPQFSAQVETM